MREWAGYEIRDGAADGAGEGARIVLTGPLRVDTLGLIEPELRGLQGTYSALDLSEITDIDTVGAWVAFRVSDRRDLPIEGADESATRLIESVKKDGSRTGDVRPPRAPVVERVLYGVGDFVREWGKGSVAVLSFFGQIMLAFAAVIRHPRRFPGKALVRQAEYVGVSALGIIGLMSFLIGIVIAQQGATQLAQYGAEALTVNLVGRISLRELGVLMTAIMVAGRSGSAFAAQIGTMKLTEEIDAMRTIGIAPMEKLVVPRILAAVLMMPLLGFYAAVMAVVGGAVISELTLDLSFSSFLVRVREVVPTYDLWVGLIKAPVFGLIVALSGCYHGMQVENNAEEVGRRTTQAVVMAIFMVIVLDAFFAVFFVQVGWK